MNKIFINGMARLVCLSVFLTCAGANTAGSGPSEIPEVRHLRQQRDRLIAEQELIEVELNRRLSQLEQLRKQISQTTAGMRGGRGGRGMAAQYEAVVLRVRDEVNRLRNALQGRANRIADVGGQLFRLGAAPVSELAEPALLARSAEAQRQAQEEQRQMQRALLHNLDRLGGAVRRLNAAALAELGPAMDPNHRIARMMRDHFREVEAAHHAPNPADAVAAASSAADSALEVASVVDEVASVVGSQAQRVLNENARQVNSDARDALAAADALSVALSVASSGSGRAVDPRLAPALPALPNPADAVAAASSATDAALEVASVVDEVASVVGSQAQRVLNEDARQARDASAADALSVALSVASSGSGRAVDPRLAPAPPALPAGSAASESSSEPRDALSVQSSSAGGSLRSQSSAP